jgi:peptidoglycan hydrolase CwlO-like protein
MNQSTLIAYRKMVIDLESQVDQLNIYLKEKQEELDKANKRIKALEKQIDNKGAKK